MKLPSNTKLSKLLLIISLLLPICACSERRHYAKKQVNVHHLDDGRYVYRDDNGMFWFYMCVLSSNNGSVYSSAGNNYGFYSTPSNINSLAKKGAWVSQKEIPEEDLPKEEQLEFDFDKSTNVVIPEEIEVGSNNQPITAEEAHEEQMEFDFGENSSNNTPESGESTAESSSGESSGGGDSGGGGGE